MATVAQIAKDLREECGKTCLSLKDICKSTGYSMDRAQKIVAKLPYIGQNTGKRWYYTDVAEGILKDGEVNTTSRKRPGRPRLLET